MYVYMSSLHVFASFVKWFPTYTYYTILSFWPDVYVCMFCLYPPSVMVFICVCVCVVEYAWSAHIARTRTIYTTRRGGGVIWVIVRWWCEFGCGVNASFSQLAALRFRQLYYIPLVCYNIKIYGHIVDLSVYGWVGIFYAFLNIMGVCVCCGFSPYTLRKIHVTCGRNRKMS